MADKKTKTNAKVSDASRAKTQMARKARKKSSKLLLTQEIIDKAARIVGQGNFRKVARSQLSVPEGTWKSWLSYGRRDLREGKESLQADLVTALDKAEGASMSSIVRDVMALGDDPASVKIKLDYMYRRNSKLFSKTGFAYDDETAETVRVDPLEALAEKLGPYMDADE